jgi:hypothetical protein
VRDAQSSGRGRRDRRALLRRPHLHHTEPRAATTPVGAGRPPLRGLCHGVCGARPALAPPATEGGWSRERPTSRRARAPSCPPLEAPARNTSTALRTSRGTPPAVGRSQRSEPSASPPSTSARPSSSRTCSRACARTRRLAGRARQVRTGQGEDLGLAGSPH